MAANSTIGWTEPTWNPVTGFHVHTNQSGNERTGHKL